MYIRVEVGQGRDREGRTEQERWGSCWSTTSSRTSWERRRWRRCQGRRMWRAAEQWSSEPLVSSSPADVNLHLGYLLYQVGIFSVDVLLSRSWSCGTSRLLQGGLGLVKVKMQKCPRSIVFDSRRQCVVLSSPAGIEVLSNSLHPAAPSSMKNHSSRFIDQLINFYWLIDWLVGRLVGWLVDWLIDWFVDKRLGLHPTLDTKRVMSKTCFPADLLSW